MTIDALPLRVTEAIRGESRHREIGLIIAAAAADAVATGVLLAGTLHPVGFEALAAALAHGLAALLVLAAFPTRPSRGWLSVGAVLAVPAVGTVVAAVTYVTCGRGLGVRGRRRATPRRRTLTRAGVERLAHALSPGDALTCGDEEKRRGAVSALARRADAEAIALLRWAAAGPDPDLALSAALALDEIAERAERSARRPRGDEARRRAG